MTKRTLLRSGVLDSVEVRSWVARLRDVELDDVLEKKLIIGKKKGLRKVV